MWQSRMEPAGDSEIPLALPEAGPHHSSESLRAGFLTDFETLSPPLQKGSLKRQLGALLIPILLLFALSGFPHCTLLAMGGGNSS